LVCVEEVAAVPGKVWKMGGSDPAKAGRRRGSAFKVEGTELGGGEDRGHDENSVVGEGDEAAVEEGVEVGGEEEAVEDVEALGVGGANGPGLGVAGAEGVGEVEAGDGAGAAPVVELGPPENVLADSLAHQAFDLGTVRQGGTEGLVEFGGVVAGRLIRKGLGDAGGGA